MTSVTVRNLPNHPGSKPLGPVPDARLVERRKDLPGILPIAGKDGSTSWQVYARPYEAEDDRPKVAIAIIGLGLSRAATMAAIGKLPPEITLVLDPYAKGLGDWLVRARLVGHEVMVALPMESEQFPIHDAGPFSMDTGLKVEDNLKRLELVLSQFTGYTGVATVMGSRFGTSESMLRPVFEVLKERGLMLVTTGSLFLSAVPKVASEIGLARVISDLTLDDEPTRAAVSAKLERLVEIARERSVGVAIARAYPVTIDRLIAWTKSLEGKKVVLVPVSAVVDTKEKKKK
ncbi:MAG: divergent polysaccharide deacetylase family protein, partial [Proteobacteria bacterium]|nr:divergent polysaccharide deacetylase family protein [Pseudomonadota bacterium]